MVGLIIKALLYKIGKVICSIIEYLVVMLFNPALIIAYFRFNVGLSLLIPLYVLWNILFAVCVYLDRRYKFSLNFPKPRERFTIEDEDGEVSIEQSRMQELILYVNEVEDYLKANGITEN